MVKFDKTGTPHGEVRTGELSELGIPTWTLLEQAIKAGDVESALKLAWYGHRETVPVHDALAEMLARISTYIADTMGEEEVGKAWMALAHGMTKDIDMRTSAKAEDVIRIAAEMQRGHSCGANRMGELEVTEEEDRFVIRLDPCPTGGLMRKTGLYGTTKKPHPWSWGKTGVLYYCAHCCVHWELHLAQLKGYPVRIHENVDRPDLPCLQIFYKEPELIPERYFTRIGMTKEVSKFRK